MVSDNVVIQKPFNYKRIFLWVFLVVIVVAVLYGVFFLGSVFGNFGSSTSFSYENPLIELLNKYEQSGIKINETQLIEQAELEFNKDYINYVLYAMSAWRLHKMPLSNDVPKIRVIIEDRTYSTQEVYNSEVIKGEIKTYVGDINNPDIIINTFKREVIGAMLSKDMTEFMKQSVGNGNTKIEMLANKLKLAGKGYLQMYKDITGEDIEVE